MSAKLEVSHKDSAIEFQNEINYQKLHGHERLQTDIESMKLSAAMIRRAIAARRREGIRITSGIGGNKLHVHRKSSGVLAVKASAGQCDPIEAVILNGRVPPIVNFNSYLDVMATASSAIKRSRKWIEVFRAGFARKPMPAVHVCYTPVYRLGERIREELLHPKRVKQDQAMITSVTHTF